MCFTCPTRPASLESSAASCSWNFAATSHIPCATACPEVADDDGSTRYSGCVVKPSKVTAAFTRFAYESVELKVRLRETRWERPVLPSWRSVELSVRWRLVPAGGIWPFSRSQSTACFAALALATCLVEKVSSSDPNEPAGPPEIETVQAYRIGCVVVAKSLKSGLGSFSLCVYSGHCQL